MYRVVIDTNVLVSAIIVKDSWPDRLLRAWREDKFTLVMCREMLVELDGVLGREKIARKYGISLEMRRRLVEELGLAASMVEEIGDEKFGCRDEKDEIVLRLAYACQADFVVSGDKDLLEMEAGDKLNKTRILMAKELMEKYIK